METVLITGGSGLIGLALSQALVTKGYSVRHLSRTVNGTEQYSTFKWNVLNSEIDPKAFENIDHIIHLAGENVGGKNWTKSQKTKILNSRVDSANLLANNFPTSQSLKSFISASGISYYGVVTSEQIFKENEPAGNDFLADVSVKWEKAAEQFNGIANRVVCLRTPIVLAKKGGALDKMKKPMKFGLGSGLGSGKQYMPWVHIDDMVNAYIHCIENNTTKGSFNICADEHVNNNEFTKTLAKAMGKKVWLPNVPAFMLKLLFGEMANIILKGSRADNSKIKETGFKFKYNSLLEALKN
jgi:uncharacterized protein (TIGR01777 family)